MQYSRTRPKSLDSTESEMRSAAEKPRLQYATKSIIVHYLVISNAPTDRPYSSTLYTNKRRKKSYALPPNYYYSTVYYIGGEVHNVPEYRARVASVVTPLHYSLSLSLSRIYCMLLHASLKKSHDAYTLVSFLLFFLYIPRELCNMATMQFDGVPAW